MGRKKIPIAKIKDVARLHVTYSKRKYGLIKKIYEISLLADVDVAFISFSQAGRLASFSRAKRVEGVFEQYTKSPAFEEKHSSEEQERILRVLDVMRTQNEANVSDDAEIKALQEEVQMKEEELKEAKASLKKFEIDNAASITSIYAIKARELILINLLQRLSDKKKFLNQTPPQLDEASNNESYHTRNQTRNYENEAPQIANPSDINSIQQRESNLHEQRPLSQPINNASTPNLPQPVPQEGDMDANQAQQMVPTEDEWSAYFGEMEDFQSFLDNFDF
ncbi:MADS-box protein AGL71-like isoform X1 [Ananas comosus]|uniref:MADS-box protein AGL71-like isoform X1 n=1 Tax=Ananas comosus TaxID=4615 RepID=A0A6P5G7U5_ANACO|nr:MADS-box protein AGL71-like isoform X1 [Ananas comosus]